MTKQQANGVLGFLAMFQIAFGILVAGQPNMLVFGIFMIVGAVFLFFRSAEVITS